MIVIFFPVGTEGTALINLANQLTTMKTLISFCTAQCSCITVILICSCLCSIECQVKPDIHAISSLSSISLLVTLGRKGSSIFV